MDQKFIEERKKDLILEKEKVEKRLSEIAEKKGKKFIPIYPEYGSEPEENAAEIEEYSLHLTLDSDLEIFLGKVLKALAKIEKGTYGKCENCKKEINLERLKAFPAADLCIKCQSKKESPIRRLFSKIRRSKK